MSRREQEKVQEPTVARCLGSCSNSLQTLSSRIGVRGCFHTSAKIVCFDFTYSTAFPDDGDKYKKETPEELHIRTYQGHTFIRN
jgi:hypothetical protein